jgi:transcription elongation factor Elf1
MKIKCPACSAEDMSIISVDESKMNMKVQCNNCGHKYTGYYTGNFEIVTALKPEIGKLRDLSKGE